MGLIIGAQTALLMHSLSGNPRVLQARRSDPTATPSWPTGSLRRSPENSHEQKNLVQNPGSDPCFACLLAIVANDDEGCRHSAELLCSCTYRLFFVVTALKRCLARTCRQ